jgi:hypothetical protein
VGARYSATALTRGDASPGRLGMIRVRDVTAGVPDLLSAQRLDSATHAIGGIQERGGSWYYATRWTSCVGKSHALGRPGQTAPSSARWPGYCPRHVAGTCSSLLAQLR